MGKQTEIALSGKEKIRLDSTRKIIAAAEQVFSKKGFEGATTREIADQAGLPKANIHYYFPTKEDLYVQVLKDILAEWIADAEVFDSSDDPETAFRAYIGRKIRHSFTRPHGSKVWAMEIIGGGKVFDVHLRSSLLEWNAKKIRQINKWIEQGKLRKVNAQYLLYSVWAMTQNYADFEYQMRIINKGKSLGLEQSEEIVENIVQLVLRGVLN